VTVANSRVAGTEVTHLRFKIRDCVIK